MNLIKKNLKNSLLKNLSIVFFENILTKGLSFLIILFLARQLGPEDYGKYSFVFVVVAFCSAFFDFGMENTAVRFSAKSHGLLNSIFGLYFIVKFIILLAVILVLVFFGGDIFAAMDKEGVVQYMPYVIIGIVAEALFFVNDTYLQAVQKYKLRASINIGRYFVILLFMIFLYFKKALLLKYVFCMYIIIFAVCLTFTIKYVTFVRSYFKIKLDKSLLKEIFSYQKWMFTLAFGANMLARTDFFMLSFYFGYASIGIYNAANQLSSIVSFLPFVLGKVLLPKLSQMEPKEIFKFSEKTFKPMLLISLLMVCAIPLAKPIIPFLLGKKYIASILVFQIMLISFILSFAFIVFENSLYALGRPQLISLAKYIQIVIIVSLNIYTLPRYGMVWAAINVTVSKVLYSSTLIFLFYKYKKSMLATVKQ